MKSRFKHCVIVFLMARLLFVVVVRVCRGGSCWTVACRCSGTPWWTASSSGCRPRWTRASTRRSASAAPRAARWWSAATSLSPGSTPPPASSTPTTTSSPPSLRWIARFFSPQRPATGSFSFFLHTFSIPFSSVPMFFAQFPVYFNRLFDSQQ